MKIYRFGPETGITITKFNSDFIINRIVETEKKAYVSATHLAPKGVIGCHQAVVPQILLIVSGEGTVRGEDDHATSVATGDAIYWDKGEWHETNTETGLMAIVVESEELNLFLLE
nr:cupin domain-containing protein [Halobacillus andaensis]